MGAAADPVGMFIGKVTNSIFCTVLKRLGVPALCLTGNKHLSCFFAEVFGCSGVLAVTASAYDVGALVVIVSLVFV